MLCGLDVPHAVPLNVPQAVPVEFISTVEEVRLPSLSKVERRLSDIGRSVKVIAWVMLIQLALGLIGLATIVAAAR